MDAAIQDDGPLPLTLGKGEEGMTITQRFDELLSDILGLADEKRRQLKVMKKHEGKYIRRTRLTCPRRGPWPILLEHQLIPMYCLLYTWQDTASLNR
jgi:hypothetical protein